MKISILQISDMHLKESGNTVTKRVDAIKRAVQGSDENSDIDVYFVTMTGDVAYSGSAAEYEIAHTFFDELRSGLQSIRPGVRVEEVFIPGNHDCSLKPENAVRNIVLDGILAKCCDAPYRPLDDLIGECLKVQDNFFDFRARRLSHKQDSDPILTGAARLFYRHQFEIEGHLLRFDCYNSAWMSQIHERPGQLLMPLDLSAQWSRDHGTDESQTPDVVMSLFHHPDNWFEPNNARAFRKEIARLSDIVMTGHEHVAEQHTKTSLEGGTSEYFEGAVLQESGYPQSGFNTLTLDLAARRRQVALYEWKDGMYQTDRSGTWQSYDRNVLRGTTFLQNTAEYSRRLHDVGANFTHPAKAQLDLEDIFIYPDFDERTFSRDNENTSLLSQVLGDKLLSYVLEHPHILFVGGDGCGKTALVKKLYLDLQEQKFAPISLDGKDIHNMDGLNRLLEDAIVDQYGASELTRYKQLDLDQKVLLVDNFHSIKLNLKGRNNVLLNLKKMAGRVVLVAEDAVQLRDFARSDEAQDAIISFRHAELREFGARLRGRLIEKWFELGREFTIDETEIAHKAKEAEHLVTTLLGKSLLPAHPLFILTILQQHEVQSNLETASGSYGYYYEVLITTALQNRSKNIPLDMIYPVVSRIAYRMFESNVKLLSEDDLEKVINDYKAKFHVDFRIEEMRRILEEAHILRRTNEGRYAFRYKYLSYYFVARYLKDNLHSREHQETLREKIREMTGKLYVGDYANVLIFLVYFTKDEQTINELLDKAKTMFQNYEPCNLSDDIAFANKLCGEAAPLQLGEGSEKEHREQHRAHLDRVKDDDDDIDDEELAEDERKFNELLDFNVALKTLQIMGQILRNFPGTLPGETKVEVIRESYLLGLRTLKALFSIVESDIVGFRSFFKDFLQAHSPLPTETVEQRQIVETRADNFVYYVVMSTAHGFIKRISYAVGSEYLKETYKLISDDRSPVAIDLINTSIKLDHFKNFPFDESVKLYADLRKNPFTSSILRRMVRDHLYLYPVDYDVRQSICAKLDIVSTDPKMLSTARKKL